MFVHLVGGEAYGVPHQPGDVVTGKASKRKVAEWVAAGIVEEVITEQEDESDDGSARQD